MTLDLSTIPEAVAIVTAYRLVRNGRPSRLPITGIRNDASLGTVGHLYSDHARNDASAVGHLYAA